MKTLVPLLTLILAIGFVGCEKKPVGTPGGGSAPGTGGGEAPPPPPPGGGAAAPVEQKSDEPAPEGTATVKGKVVLDGTAPTMRPLAGIDGKPECADQHDETPLAEVVLAGPAGELGNAFVYVSKGVKWKYPRPAEAVAVDQAKCIYTPHVIGVQVGQKVSITNSDPTLHNVHILASPALGDKNFAQPGGAPAIEVKFRKPALGVSVKCDVHPWMQMYACVVDHPFFAVTGADGTFELPAKLPAGTYTVTVWHELYGTVDQEVTVADGETKELSLSVKVK